MNKKGIILRRLHRYTYSCFKISSKADHFTRLCNIFSKIFLQKKKNSNTNEIRFFISLASQFSNRKTGGNESLSIIKFFPLQYVQLFVLETNKIWFSFQDFSFTLPYPSLSTYENANCFHFAVVDILVPR